MKTTNIISMLAVLLVVSCTSTKIATETELQNLAKVDNKDFSIQVNYANPLRMQQIALTSEYDLKIKNDSAFAFLPFYGVAHTAPLNPMEGGIKFSEPVKDYKSSPTRKNDGRQISFKVNTNEYHYQINMTVFQNGTASISINSTERDPIIFYGEMK